MKSSYFKQRIAEVNENYLAADGNWNNADNWNRASGFDSAQSQMMAEGAQMAQPRPPANSQSLPYIVILENTTTDTVTDVTIFNSAVTAGNNYAISGISITWGLQGVLYNTVLGRINSGQVFTIGQMRLIASSSVTGRDEQQVLNPVKLFTNTIDGKSSSLQLNLQKDSFQQIKNQVDSFYEFMIDSMTGMTFTILGLTTLQVYLYPKAAVNPFNQLKGETGASTYANPNTNFSLNK